MTADHEPVTWCRVLMVGLPCSHPCVDCKRADANYTDAEAIAAADVLARAGKVAVVWPVEVE